MILMPAPNHGGGGAGGLPHWCRGGVGFGRVRCARAAGAGVGLPACGRYTRPRRVASEMPWTGRKNEPSHPARALCCLQAAGGRQPLQLPACVFSHGTSIPGTLSAGCWRSTWSTPPPPWWLMPLSTCLGSHCCTWCTPRRAPRPPAWCSPTALVRRGGRGRVGEGRRCESVLVVVVLEGALCKIGRAHV